MKPPAADKRLIAGILKEFDENKHAAIQGGSVAGTARKELDEKSGKNYLPEKKTKKLKTDQSD